MLVGNKPDSEMLLLDVIPPVAGPRNDGRQAGGESDCA
ncbi:hypothetical protein ACLB1Q_30940 [Escherichia coli]